ncbi:hypothetical protein [Bacillus sp. OK048]|uniref:hypothetical protein n=1 Tax=Bacillus sp. OK048 TaxID=1882761 RepID=UPI00088DAA88|nr:hypothetical protein [Bacillus sp. OK048]SDM18056.1 hypothetical protein SAMN05443253_102195 [Bacillus sp. OK048]
MLKVNLISFEDLTQQEQEDQPDNGPGKEYANYIKITDSANTLLILSDAVEPEDATFRRDFKGVVRAIEQAYKIGLRDGKKFTS